MEKVEPELEPKTNNFGSATLKMRMALCALYFPRPMCTSAKLIS